MSISTNDEHFDAVIVGSGFGGSVMAYRLAEAGLRVCVLERGKPYPPNSFPRSPAGMKHNFWDPAGGLYGMFNVWSFSGLASVVSSGLGGGSLIYANVLIRKDEKWFVREDLQNGGHEYWPVTRADLDPHYDRVETMMNAQTYPYAESTSKTKAFKYAADTLGLDWHLPKLAVTFANEGEEPIPGEPIREEHGNLHGRTRYTCRLCGECDVGCNYGSKNTLDYNYLSEAKRLGAEIRTLCEVTTFEPRDGGEYAVCYVQHDPENAPGVPVADLPARTLTADRLVLAAGTLGSTYLMLKNRRAFPGISERLGERFCGNGDLLSWALKCAEVSNGRRLPRVIDGGHGPVITSTIRIPDTADGGDGRGFYLQDAGYPEFANWMMQMIDSPKALWGWRRVAGRLVGSRLLRRKKIETDIGAEISGFFGDCELSAGLLPLLGMGRDIPDGTIRLSDDGALSVDWKIATSKEYFERVSGTMREVSNALGARYVPNPTWHLDRVITVHPLGGCSMGHHEGEGVVNPYGEVFNYPGLYVADGSVMPGPTGANPSLTIAALADRFADRLIDTRPTGGHARHSTGSVDIDTAEVPN